MTRVELENGDYPSEAKAAALTSRWTFELLVAWTVNNCPFPEAFGNPFRPLKRI